MREWENGIQDNWLGAARVAQQFSTAFHLGCDPGDPGSSPTSGSLHGACFSLCLCLSYSNHFASLQQPYHIGTLQCTDEETEIHVMVIAEIHEAS